MQIKQANKKVSGSFPVLVLGRGIVARRIARELDSAGFTSSVQADMQIELPTPREPDANENLKTILNEFRDQSPYSEGQFFIHPGVSMWAERPELALIGQELDFNVIAPPPRVLSLFSNKFNFLIEADRLGVPHLVVNFSPMQSPREVLEKIKTFPFVLKSTWNEGGRQVIWEPDEIEKKLPFWLDQLRWNMGESILYAERYIDGARHLIAPFARLPDGHLELFPLVDSSLQTGNRKLIEFCPAGNLDEFVEDDIHKWIKVITEKCGFVGVGSFDFLIDGSRSFLINGSAGLNSTFHLWAEIHGSSPVAWQLASFLGTERPESLHKKDQKRIGVSLQFYSEDPLLGIPQPGFIQEVSKDVDSGQQLSFSNSKSELDLEVSEGMTVFQKSDGLIGLLYVFSPTRKQTVELAKKTLSKVWFAGGLRTNERYLAEILNHPWVVEGLFHCGFVENEFLPTFHVPPEVDKTCSGLCQILDMKKNPDARWMIGDRRFEFEPENLEWNSGPEYWIHMGLPGLSGILKNKDRICAFPIAYDRWMIRIGNWFRLIRRLGPVEKRHENKTAYYPLYSQLSGTVHSVLFRSGGEVPPHTPIVIIESLHRLIPHSFPFAVIVRDVKVKAEDVVTLGERLAELERRI